MTGKVLNLKIGNPLKLLSALTGKAPCNMPLILQFVVERTLSSSRPSSCLQKTILPGLEGCKACSQVRILKIPKNVSCSQSHRAIFDQIMYIVYLERKWFLEGHHFSPQDLITFVPLNRHILKP